MSIDVITIIAGVFALAAAILAFIFIVPAKKRNKLNGFGKVVHDLLNFKDLWIEKAFKFLYVLSTAYSILLGFFMLFWVETYSYGGYYSYYDYSYVPGTTYHEWMGYYGFLVMILGPIAIRITYEFIMMIILACKNINDINNKLPNMCEAAEAKAEVKQEVATNNNYATVSATAPETESYYNKF